MTCELCHQNPATFHLTEVMGGTVRELHLCDDCTKQKGVSYKSASIGELMGQAQAVAAKPPARSGPEVKCPDCGLTYGEFRSKARLGCGRDYELFKSGLLPLLEKIHGATQHTGKIPRRAERAASLAREVRLLETRLQALVKEEAFEEAASVRNRIRALKEQAAGEGKP